MSPVSDRLRTRVQKDRPMTKISMNLPQDVIEELKALAPKLGFSGYQPLIRAYIGRGLRESSPEHLWDAVHPGDPRFNPKREFETWADFAEEFGGPDYVADNLIWRWDWLVYTTLRDGETEYLTPPIKRPEARKNHHELWLQMMQHRRGQIMEILVKLAPEDEGEVRNYLELHAGTMRALWDTLGGL